MEEEKRNVNAGGRGITVYIPEYEEQAYNYCLLGATNETLAEFFGVCPATIKKWMKKYQGFGESVRRGKLMADMKVAGNLYIRAVGILTSRWLHTELKCRQKNKFFSYYGRNLFE
ncbi:hypothetical protein [Emticicia sp. C21]|uniref:hypothetical protein n=1 Tax=Emticicia sp. C21 TaxID=2302915 RepID=UPI000E350CE9|nr:hypothetical protein [Emticicia sp. C21]RFS16821.1 hypothetical protein D0T08_09065 [Emticicia sp. C21]